MNGFQWLDGCFLESGRRKRKEPDHIQVVTFFHPPPGFPKSEHAQRFAKVINPKAKSNYLVDHVPVRLDWPPELLIYHTRYWCGRLSHESETAVWKGMVRIDLDSFEDDAAAIQHLARMEVRRA